MSEPIEEASSEEIAELVRKRANRCHAEHVAGEIACYARRRFADLDGDREDVETVLSDMLADMFHYAKTLGIDPAELVLRARGHFEEEEKGADE